MSELQAKPVDIKKVLIDSGSHKRNHARIQKDEEELAELIRQAKGEVDEETTEDKPSSEKPEAEAVQAEGDTKQKEEPKAEAQEDDAELSAEEKNFKKRYGDLRRHQQEKEKEFNEKLEALQMQLEKATKNELVLPKSDEEIDAWAKKYPDVAGIVEAIAAKEADKKANNLSERMAELEELRVTARREKAEAELAGIHPDFAQIRSDDVFHNWAKEQPKWVQDALYENVEDAKSVARVIDLYKVDKGIVSKKNNGSDKAAASSVKTKGAKPEANDSNQYLKESDVAAMSIKEYEKRADEIMEAQRSGRFIYDMKR